jgi:hypothetical protein
MEIYPHQFKQKAQMAPTREETDAIGAIQVDSTRYWGAQTQRSLQNFDIGRDFARMPMPVIKAMATLKKACAKYNAAAGKIEESVGSAIVKAADEVIAGDLMDHFPLVTIMFRLMSGLYSHTLQSLGRVPNWLRYPDKYEHKRGHLKPCHRDHGWQAWEQEPSAPQRPCQHGHGASLPSVVRSHHS